MNGELSSLERYYFAGVTFSNYCLMTLSANKVSFMLPYVYVMFRDGSTERASKCSQNLHRT